MNYIFFFLENIISKYYWIIYSFAKCNKLEKIEQYWNEMVEKYYYYFI